MDGGPAKMPATMSGPAVGRAARGAAACVTVEGSIDVSAPLVAGKIEDLISREITKLIAAQQEFASSGWPDPPERPPRARA